MKNTLYNQAKEGDLVEFIGTGTYWRDTALHQRVGTIVFKNEAGISIEWSTKTGKKHMETIRPDDMICRITRIFKTYLSGDMGSVN